MSERPEIRAPATNSLGALYFNNLGLYGKHFAYSARGRVETFSRVLLNQQRLGLVPQPIPTF
jgi:hypothetical protein